MELKRHIFVGSGLCARVSVCLVVLFDLVNVVLSTELTCDGQTQFESTNGLRCCLVKIGLSRIRSNHHLCVDDAIWRLVQEGVKVKLPVLLVFYRLADVRIRFATYSVDKRVIGDNVSLHIICEPNVKN